MDTGKVLAAVRTKVGLVAVGGALLAVGLGVGAGIAVGAPGTRPVADTSPVTTPTAPPAEATPTVTPPAPTVVSVPEQPVEPTPVYEQTRTAVSTAAQRTAPETVPEPARVPASAPEPEPAPVSTAEVPEAEVPVVGDRAGDSYDPGAPFTDSAGVTYVPAPVEVIPPMKGEPGYVPPVG